MSYGTLAEWVLAIATILLFIAAIIAAIIAYRQLKALMDSADQQRLSALMNEITNDDASFDRGFVRKYVRSDADAKDIKKYVEDGRSLTREIQYANINQKRLDKSRDALNPALIGIAIEKTIVRYDRVALFILRKNNKFRLVPANWVLTDVNMIWSRLEGWIKYRRETDDPEYMNPQYARDLERLYKHPETEKLRDKGTTKSE